MQTAGPVDAIERLIVVPVALNKAALDSGGPIEIDADVVTALAAGAADLLAVRAMGELEDEGRQRVAALDSTRTGAPATLH